ncbi:CerR family C-terminal domain-containing protein [Desulfogranum mediterraneum]|uniref:CerR family C-terminal domain-containing protein n=1 Tax=Desulfogranum mediterraneum TaxID=160661 RepID=UPI00042A112C|nr:CerR family C-terminal domain-containing protein [Desulfogranum mediterraneum]
MAKTTRTTREQLVYAAGELFAELGFDGVSTRMIAEKAGITLGSIHYHFGSKKNLYLEAFSYALEEKRCNGFLEVLEENPRLVEQPTGQAELIRTAVYRNFHEYFRAEKPRWERQILVRELVTPSSAIPLIVERFFKPDMEATRQFYRKIKPGAGDKEINTWMDILHGQIFFYSAIEEVLDLVRGEEISDVAFYREAARTVSRAMITFLDLPLPKDLQ